MKYPLFNLYDVEDDLFALGILSGRKDGERILSFAFPPPGQSNAVPIEECKNAVAFASRLFGGFSAPQDVFDAFRRDYGQDDTKIVSYSNLNSDGTQNYYWESMVSGAICRLTMRQIRKDESSLYITSIHIASDWDTFYGN